MIDVHRFVLTQRRDDEINHSFECLAFLLIGEGPEAAVDGRTGGIERDQSEQVFTSTFGSEGIALEIEEHVAGRRLGQTQQSLLFLELTQFVNRGHLAT